MSVFLNDHRIAYFSVPKCGCTSLKSLFFEIENGIPIERLRANGQIVNVHVLYPGLAFARAMRESAGDWLRIAVVRDPVSRILSAYENRGIHHGFLRDLELTQEQRKRGLVPSPTIHEFLRNMKAYRSLSRDVEHHTRPITHFLGKDPGVFDRIFRMSELDEMVALLRERIGSVPALGHKQRGLRKLSRDDLSAEEIAKIERIFAEEIELFGRWMRPEGS